MATAGDVGAAAHEAIGIMTLCDMPGISKAAWEAAKREYNKIVDLGDGRVVIPLWTSVDEA